MVPRLMVILSSAALLAFGLVMVYSASSIIAYVEQGDALGEGLKQILFAISGIMLCIVAIRCSTDELLGGAVGLGFWVVCVILLLATAVMGTSALGAQRWLVIGPIGIQISEFLKIALTIMAARIACAYDAGEIDSMETAKRVLLFVLAPLVFLFFAQSDLGTTFICIVALVTVLILSGVSGRTLAMVLGACAICVVLAIALMGYRSDRMIFIDPWSDPKGAGYQLIQSFKAFAAGGFLGVGIGNSYEKLLYLPEAETDFIFAIIGEELGLAGTVSVVACFVVFALGGYRIAENASSELGRLVAGALTTMLVAQAFINIFCVTGLFPTTGKPLPFISSGGSSLWSTLLTVGVILGVSFNSESNQEFQERREQLHVVSSASAHGRGDVRRPVYSEVQSSHYGVAPRVPERHRSRHLDGGHLNSKESSSFSRRR